MKKIGLTIDEVVSSVSLIIISRLKGKKINSDQKLVDRIHEEEDLHKTYYSNMVYGRMVKIVVRDNVFWFGLGKRTGMESFETLGLVLVNIKFWPYCLEKTKRDKELFEVIINKHNCFRESRVFISYKDGSFWLNEDIDILSSKELVDKYVVQKPEFNSEYVCGMVEKYIEQEILYNEDFIDYLAERLVWYIQSR